MEDDPGPTVVWLLASGDAVETIVLITSLIFVIVTVAAGTAIRTFRWPRLEKLLGGGPRIERIESLLKNERAILDGLLVLRLVTSITLLLALLGWFGGSTDITGGRFLGNLGLSLLVFLGGVYGLVRGLVRHAPERALLLLLTPSRALAAAMSPLVWIMDGIGKVAARAFGLQVNEDEQEEAVEDILDAVSEGERDGAIDDEEREMIENIIEVRDQAVSQVMTPRTSVFGLATDTSLEDAVRAVVEHGHSRIPVYEDTIDNIRGILYAKDLLRHWTNGNGAASTTADEIMRAALFIPETKNTSDLLEELRRGKVHMAIVVDEYGGTAGIITIEDIIEEIIGEIEDEYDTGEDAARPSLKIIAERESAEVDALFHIDELNDALHLELPEGDSYDTVGGFLFHRMGRIPEAGESCEFENVRFEILEADERRIHSVKVTVGD